MKTTEKFDHDFRPIQPKYEDEHKEHHPLLSSDEILMEVQLTFVRFGLSTSFNK